MAECSRSCVGRRGFFICVGLPLFACKHGVHNELWEGQAGWKRGPVCVYVCVCLGVGGTESFMALSSLRSQGSSIPSFHPQTFQTSLLSVLSLVCGASLSPLPGQFKGFGDDIRHNCLRSPQMPNPANSGVCGATTRG